MSAALREFPVRPDLDAISARDERREPTMVDSPRRDLRELLVWVRHLEATLNRIATGAGPLPLLPHDDRDHRSRGPRGLR